MSSSLNTNSSKSSDEQFETAVDKLSNKGSPVKNSKIDENTQRVPEETALDTVVADTGNNNDVLESPVKYKIDDNIQKVPEEIASDTVVADPGYNIDTLLDRYGFFLGSKSFRAVCLTNAPETVEEVLKADNLKAVIPEFVQKKTVPKLKSDDRTPPDLLVRLKDIPKNMKTENLERKTGKEMSPIQNDDIYRVEIIDVPNSDGEQLANGLGEGAAENPTSNLPISCELETEVEIEAPNCDKERETKDLEEGTAENPISNISTCELNDDNIDLIDKDIGNPATTNMITQTEENVSSASTSQIKTSETNNRNRIEKEPRMVPSTAQQQQFTAARRAPYLTKEEKAILRYILDGNFEGILRGNFLWKKMQDDGVCPGRPWQSIKNRFKRNIFNNLSRPEFQLTAQEISRLKEPKKGSALRGQQNIVRNLRARTASTAPKLRDAMEGFYDLDMNWSDSDSNSTD